MDPIFKVYSSECSLAAVNDGDHQWLMLSTAPQQWTKDLLERFGELHSLIEVMVVWNGPADSVVPGP